MTRVSHQPCPCGDSSDAYSYDPDKQVGYCHSCSKGFSLKGEHPTEQESTGNMQQYEEVEEYTEYRKVKPATLKYYGVQDTYDQRSGDLIGHTYPYDRGKKLRKFPKDFTALNGFKSNQLFGMDKFNAGQYECVITEGELDAMSAYQMLNGTPCISLPSASPSQELWSNEKVMSWLGSFEKIYCSFDSDGKSDYIINKLGLMFPNRVFHIPHTKYKDANEFLQAGASDAFRSAKKNARKFVPVNMWNTADDFVTILKDEGAGECIPTGIQAWDEYLGGLYTGYVLVLQAPAGVGKSEVCRLLEYNILSQQDVPIAVMHMEDKKSRVLRGLACYYLNMNVIDSRLLSEEVESEVESAIRKVGEDGKLWLFELSESDDPKDILQRIRFMAVGLGVKAFFFEPIQDLAVNRQDGSTASVWLTEFSTKLAFLARELDIAIVTVAHENDDGLIRDCRMIYSRAGVVVHLERDKMDEDPEAKNTTRLWSDKNRPTALTGDIASLKFDPETFTLKELVV